MAVFHWEWLKTLTCLYWNPTWWSVVIIQFHCTFAWRFCISILFNNLVLVKLTPLNFYNFFSFPLWYIYSNKKLITTLWQLMINIVLHYFIVLMPCEFNKHQTIILNNEIKYWNHKQQSKKPNPYKFKWQNTEILGNSWKHARRSVQNLPGVVLCWPLVVTGTEKTGWVPCDPDLLWPLTDRRGKQNVDLNHYRSNFATQLSL